MKKYFILFNLIFAMALPAYANIAPMANVEYIHNAIQQKHGISIPIHSATMPGRAANMEYLLCLVDIANIKLNDRKTTAYCNTQFATQQAVNTIAVNAAIENHIQLQAGISIPENAGSVILMIGDGVGINHINCAGGFIASLGTPPAWVSTACASTNCITDSAAAATAYACGRKTNNQYIGMTPDGKICKTVAEQSVASGYGVVIATSDSIIGATPASFYAHSTSRYSDAEIESWLRKSAPMVIYGGLASPADYTAQLINKYNTQGGADGRINGKPFFWMIEEGLTDPTSHDNNYSAMILRMNDFNNAVQAAVEFVNANPEITLIITGDHETGGLNTSCKFTSGSHTGVNIPLYAFGAHSAMFTGVISNDQVGIKIRQILFPEN